MKKLSDKLISILLTLVMVVGMAPLPVHAAAGDVTAKEMTVVGAAGNNKLGNLETSGIILFDGTWPGDGWTAESVGLIPAPTALNQSAIDNAFMYLECDVSYPANINNLIVSELDMTSYWDGTITPGNYRVVVYATPPSGSFADEEIFCSFDIVEVVEGLGYLYDISASTLTVTDGGAVGIPTQLTLHLDFGGGVVTLMPEDKIYLDFINLVEQDDPIDFADAILTSPTAFSFMDMGVPPGTPQTMVGMEVGGSYTVMPTGVDFVIDGAIPLLEYAAAIVKIVREPEPPGQFVGLGYWEGEFIFEGGSVTPGLNIGATTLTAPYYAFVNRATTLTLTLKANGALHMSPGDSIAIDASGLDFANAALPADYTLVTKQNGRLEFAFSGAAQLSDSNDSIEIEISGVIPDSVNVSGARLILKRAEENDLTKNFGVLYFLPESSLLSADISGYEVQIQTPYNNLFSTLTIAPTADTSLQSGTWLTITIPGAVFSPDNNPYMSFSGGSLMRPSYEVRDNGQTLAFYATTRTFRQGDRFTVHGVLTPADGSADYTLSIDEANKTWYTPESVIQKSGSIPLREAEIGIALAPSDGNINLLSDCSSIISGIRLEYVDALTGDSLNLSLSGDNNIRYNWSSDMPTDDPLYINGNDGDAGTLDIGSFRRVAPKSGIIPSTDTTALRITGSQESIPADRIQLTDSVDLTVIWPKDYKYLAGRLINEADGQPVEGAAIGTYNGFTVTTDANGEFSLLCPRDMFMYGRTKCDLYVTPPGARQFPIRDVDYQTEMTLAANNRDYALNDDIYAPLPLEIPLTVYEERTDAVGNPILTPLPLERYDDLFIDLSRAGINSEVVHLVSNKYRTISRPDRMTPYGDGVLLSFDGIDVRARESVGGQYAMEIWDKLKPEEVIENVNVFAIDASRMNEYLSVDGLDSSTRRSEPVTVNYLTDASITVKSSGQDLIMAVYRTGKFYAGGYVDVGGSATYPIFHNRMNDTAIRFGDSLRGPVSVVYFHSGWGAQNAQQNINDYERLGFVEGIDFIRKDIDVQPGKSFVFEAQEVFNPEEYTLFDKDVTRLISMTKLVDGEQRLTLSVPVKINTGRLTNYGIQLILPKGCTIDTFPKDKFLRYGSLNFYVDELYDDGSRAYYIDIGNTSWDGLNPLMAGDLHEITISVKKEANSAGGITGVVEYNYMDTRQKLPLGVIDISSVPLAFYAPNTLYEGDFVLSGHSIPGQTVTIESADGLFAATEVTANMVGRYEAGFTIPEGIIYKGQWLTFIATVTAPEGHELAGETARIAAESMFAGDEPLIIDSLTASYSWQDGVGWNKQRHNVEEYLIKDGQKTDLPFFQTYNNSMEDYPPYPVTLVAKTYPHINDADIESMTVVDKSLGTNGDTERSIPMEYDSALGAWVSTERVIWYSTLRNISVDYTLKWQEPRIPEYGITNGAVTLNGSPLEAPKTIEKVVDENPELGKIAFMTSDVLNGVTDDGEAYSSYYSQVNLEGGQSGDIQMFFEGAALENPTVNGQPVNAAFFEADGWNPTDAGDGNTFWGKLFFTLEAEDGTTLEYDPLRSWNLDGSPGVGASPEELAAFLNKPGSVTINTYTLGAMTGPDGNILGMAVDETDQTQTRAQSQLLAAKGFSALSSAPELRSNAPELRSNAPELRSNLPELRSNSPEWRDNSPILQRPSPALQAEINARQGAEAFQNQINDFVSGYLPSLEDIGGIIASVGGMWLEGGSKGAQSFSGVAGPLSDAAGHALTLADLMALGTEYESECRQLGEMIYSNLGVTESKFVDTGDWSGMVQEQAPLQYNQDFLAMPSDLRGMLMDSYNSAATMKNCMDGELGLYEVGLGGLSLFAGPGAQLIGGTALSKHLNNRADAYRRELEAIKALREKMRNERKNWKEKTRKRTFIFIIIIFIRDPSGIAYEGMEDFKLDCVNATIWVADDENGANARLWDAEPFDQLNPQLTGQGGYYAWDVPDGWWQIRVEKDGYENAASEWLPVPPPQADVNLHMSSTGSPDINMDGTGWTFDGDDYESGNEVLGITFTKAMKLGETSSAITLWADGDQVPAVVTPRQIKDDSPFGDLAYEFTVVPESGFRSDITYTLKVGEDAVAYNGKPLSSGYSREYIASSDDQETYALTVSAGTGGAVSGTQSGNYAPGTAISVTAAANSNYRFNGWTVTGVTLASSTVNPAVFNMPAEAVTINANFTYSGGGANTTPTNPPPTTTPTNPPTTLPDDNGEKTKLPNGATVDTSKGKDPVKNDDGSITLPNGGVIALPNGTIITVPAGTIISADGKTVIIPEGNGGSEIDHPNGHTIKTPEDIKILLDNGIPLGYKIAADNPFGDVKPDDWFYDTVMFAYSHGLMVGASSDPMLFSPNITTTRGMMVTILYRMAGNPDVNGLSNPFNDVPEETWYTDAVKWAAANGIVGGYGNGQYGPSDDITREQMAVILANYIKYKGYTLPSNVTTAFVDESGIASWALEAVRMIHSAGIVGGKPGGIYDPKGIATRAEIATIFARFIEILAKYG